jgi:hypothetical protein
MVLHRRSNHLSVYPPGCLEQVLAVFPAEELFSILQTQDSQLLLTTRADGTDLGQDKFVPSNDGNEVTRRCKRVTAYLPASRREHGQTTSGEPVPHPDRSVKR